MICWGLAGCACRSRCSGGWAEDFGCIWHVAAGVEIVYVLYSYYYDFKYNQANKHCKQIFQSREKVTS